MVDIELKLVAPPEGGTGAVGKICSYVVEYVRVVNGLEVLVGLRKHNV